MAKKIIHLCKELEKWLQSNGGSDNIYIDSFYIGKTNDIERRREEHATNDELDFTLEIAHGDSKIIKKAEHHMIMYFQQTNLKNKLKNTDSNADGNSEAQKLYVSYHANLVNVRNIDDLDADELSWPESYEIKE